MSRQAGVSEAQVQAISNYTQSDAFSPLEKLVLDYAVALTETPVVMPDELFSALQQQLNPAQLVELTALVAWENCRARFNHAFGIESQEFSEGAFCLVPPRPPISNIEK